MDFRSTDRDSYIGTHLLRVLQCVVAARKPSATRSDLGGGRKFTRPPGAFGQERSIYYSVLRAEFSTEEHFRRRVAKLGEMERAAARGRNEEME